MVIVVPNTDMHSCWFDSTLSSQACCADVLQKMRLIKSRRNKSYVKNFPSWIECKRNHTFVFLQCSVDNYIKLLFWKLPNDEITEAIPVHLKCRWSFTCENFFKQSTPYFLVIKIGNLISVHCALITTLQWVGRWYYWSWKLAVNVTGLERSSGCWELSWVDFS